MASSYKPPHKRDNMENTKSFPALNKTTPVQIEKNSKSGFSKMVYNLIAADEEAARIEENERIRGIREAVTIPVSTANLHTLREEMKPGVEDEPEDFEKNSPIDPDNEGWKVVKPRRKPRRHLTLEEKIVREEEEERLRKGQDVDWNDNTPAAHETSWDERN
jgi:hypothetical protein